MRTLPLFPLLVFALTLCSCGFDPLEDYCTDASGSFHFKGAVPPLKAGNLPESVPIDYEVVVFQAIPDFTFQDLGELGPTYVLLVSHGGASLDFTVSLLKSYLTREGYCKERMCTTEPFSYGENSGECLMWQFSMSGILWYAREFLFVREGVLYHISVQSIRSSLKPETERLLASFTPGPPPQATSCQSSITLPTYTPEAVFQ